MQDVLDQLVKIQSLDDEIRKTQSRIDKIPQSIAALEHDVAQAKKELQEKQNRIQTVVKSYKMKEGDVAENEAKINKLNSQTYAVKTNEEYRALISEIEFLKKENKRIEDEMISLLEEEDKLKRTIGTFEATTKALINDKISEINALKRESESLTVLVGKMNSNLDELFKALPDDVMKLYKKIQKVRDRVVCLVENETCTGCSAILTPQFLNELKKRDEILLCSNCGRILIFAVPNL